LHWSFTMSETRPSWKGRGSIDPVKAHRIDITSAVFPLPLLKEWGHKQ
jgi:hypothetical protein